VVARVSRLAWLTVIGVALGGCTLQRDLSEIPAPTVRPGTPAPAFTGSTLEGRPISLRDYAGQSVVLNFWGSWCPPCRTEQGGLQRLSQEFQGRGVQFVGINIRDSEGNARAHQHEFGVTYPSVFDRPAEWAARYQVVAPPSTVLIDARGFLVYRSMGALNETELRGLILVKLLGEKNYT
jgi:peroxiredoxin